MQEQPYGLRVLGRIVNVLADEKVLDEAGKIDAGKLQTFAFDQMRHGYYAMGEKSGPGVAQRRGADEAGGLSPSSDGPSAAGEKDRAPLEEGEPGFVHVKRRSGGCR